MITQSKASSAIAYAIDSPGALQAPEGFLQLSGWLAGESAAGAQIRLRLGPTSLFDCRTGEARPDVLAVHPDLPGAAESGFRLETYVPPGFHVGTFEYRSAGQSDWIPFHTLSIIAGLSPLFAQLECQPPTEPTKNWYVQGWCFHPQCEIESVTVQFAHKQAVLEHGSQRPDVAGLYPQYHSALNSGFAGYFSIEPGHAPLNLKVKLRNGSVVQKIMLPALAIQDRDLERAQQLASKIRAAQIKLATPAQPDVSIIIPVYNQLDFTLGCLESLVRHAGQTTFEVIIMDDKSDPFVPETLSLVDGLRIHSNPKNEGFVLNCNRGVTLAKGRFVLMLNNDTEVQAGWLEALLEVFANRPEAGLVGAKLIYPDGTLQEAGGICWDDGSAWNFGRNQSPDRSEFNYIREVDYCSGACIIVPRDLWITLEGFDPSYAPAYYEDSDLAFRIRAAGRKVYYQPRCVVVHFEGKSNGTDTAAGVKRHQVINQATFLKRWQDVLTRDQFPNATNLFFARDRSRHKSSILICDHYVPMFDRDAGSRTIFEYVRLFVRHGFNVKFLPDNLYPHEPYTTALQQLGVEVLYGGHLVSTIHDWIRENARFFDYVFISRAQVASKYLSTFKASTDATILFYGSDLHFMRMEAEAATLRVDNAAEVAAMRKMEEGVLQQVDVAYYPAAFECDWVREHFPSKKVRVFPIYIYTDNTDSWPVYENSADILFVGGFGHPPNCTALRWFIESSFHRILEQLPEVRLHVAGSNIPPDILALQSEAIRFFPNVSDAELSALYARTRVCVVPLRYGGGVKGKVVDALYRRIPLVTTSVGAQGLDDVGSVARISDAPLEFADDVVEIYRTPAKWHALSRSSRPYILERFSLDAVTRMLAQDIPELKSQGSPSLLNPGENVQMPR